MATLTELLPIAKIRNGIDESLSLSPTISRDRGWRRHPGIGCDVTMGIQRGVNRIPGFTTNTKNSGGLVHINLATVLY